MEYLNKSDKLINSFIKAMKVKIDCKLNMCAGK